MEKGRMKSTETHVSAFISCLFQKSVSHLHSCAAAESQNEDLRRFELVIIEQVKDALGKNGCLAASGPRDDLAGPKAAADRLPLGGIKI